MNGVTPRHYVRWDGSTKDFTKDCVGCEFYRQIGKKDYCGVGVAFKVLNPADSPRSCNLIISNEAQRNPSVAYLDEVISRRRIS